MCDDSCPQSCPSVHPSTQPLVNRRQVCQAVPILWRPPTRHWGRCYTAPSSGLIEDTLRRNKATSACEQPWSCHLSLPHAQLPPPTAWAVAVPPRVSGSGLDTSTNPKKFYTYRISADVAKILVLTWWGRKVELDDHDFAAPKERMNFDISNEKTLTSGK